MNIPQKFTVIVKQFDQYPSLSDIMLISGKNVVDGKSKIIPNVSRNLVSDRDPLDMFYEIYSDTNRNLTIDYEIFNESTTGLHIISDCQSKIRQESDFS